MKSFNFISTFAGIGGFDLGFERAGMTCLEQVEKSPHCLKLLGDKFPRAKRFNDIKEYTRHGRRKTINLICGGFPCQDVSIAGRRAGLNGERSGLYFELTRVISEYRPEWTVIENVAGLLSSNGGRDFEIVLEDLVKLGYSVSWRVFDSQFFGIPQRRRRVFIIGSLGSGSSASVLFESEGLSRYPSKSKEARKEDPPGSRAGSPRGRGGRVSPTITGSGSGTSYPAGIDYDKNLDFLVAPDEPKVYNWGSGYSDDLKDEAQTLRANGERNSQILVMSSGQANSEILEDKSPTLTLLHEAPIVAYKIRSGSGDGGKGYLGDSETAFTVKRKQDQNIGLRRFTPLECERLQGFPDNWTQGFSDTVRYEMLGNAVSVPVAKWIGKRIIQISRGG